MNPRHCSRSLHPAPTVLGQPDNPPSGQAANRSLRPRVTASNSNLLHQSPAGLGADGGMDRRFPSGGVGGLQWGLGANTLHSRKTRVDL